MIACPYCKENLAMQGVIWIEYGEPITAGICYNQKCQSKGNPIKFKIKEKNE
jgi:hypothetical protein